MKIVIGANVVSSDGVKLGKVGRVVLSPENMKLLDIIVCKGFFSHRDSLIPIAAVAKATESEIHLSLDAKEVSALPLYLADEFARPARRTQSQGYLQGTVPTPTSAYPYPLGNSYFPRLGRREVRREMPGEVEISEGTQVKAIDGSVGRMEKVEIDADTGRAQAFVVHRGLLLAKDVSVPTKWVAAVSDDSVNLNVNREQVEHLVEEG
jgi:uncharacterized protein YrrD